MSEAHISTAHAAGKQIKSNMRSRPSRGRHTTARKPIKAKRWNKKIVSGEYDVLESVVLYVRTLTALNLCTALRKNRINFRCSSYKSCMSRSASAHIHRHADGKYTICGRIAILGRAASARAEASCVHGGEERCSRGARVRVRHGTGSNSIHFQGFDGRRWRSRRQEWR